MKHAATVKWFHGRLLIEVWDRVDGKRVGGHFVDHVTSNPLAFVPKPNHPRTSSAAVRARVVLAALLGGMYQR